METRLRVLAAVTLVLWCAAYWWTVDRRFHRTWQARAIEHCASTPGHTRAQCEDAAHSHDHECFDRCVYRGGKGTRARLDVNRYTVCVTSGLAALETFDAEQRALMRGAQVPRQIP